MNHKTKQLLPLIGLLVTYGIAYGLDRWANYLRAAQSMAAISPFAQFALWSFAPLILAVCVLGLYTWGFSRLATGLLIAIVILGLLVDLIPVLLWAPFLLSIPYGPLALFLQQLMTIRGYLLAVGGWTAVAGIFTLVRRRVEK